ncbi:hypothetical protein C1N32_21600 [Vibrio diazotrophicus]|uniref:Uncharacterized protein n=1 Tax=Vibrio diazotrophicus TaxID=685 RepID=A0A2J8HPS3_VIBDI|nr:hypothetical protein [Vibrio diazotrophicus]PNI00288.1 hypothetical protein C1N32_21600 [Vibrio diazotrophicus]
MKKLLVVLLLLTGCTRSLWEYNEKYYETLLGFYLVEGEHKVLAVGEKYSYMLELKPNMYDALKLSREVDFSLRLRKFSIDDDNRISGLVKLTTQVSSISQENVSYLNTLGFQEGVSSSYISDEWQLHGERYLGSDSYPMVTLEKGVTVAIGYQGDKFDVAGRIIATPVTLAFDTLVLTPLMVGVVIVYAANGSFK